MHLCAQGNACARTTVVTPPRRPGDAIVVGTTAQKHWQLAIPTAALDCTEHRMPHSAGLQTRPRATGQLQMRDPATPSRCSPCLPAHKVNDHILLNRFTCFPAEHTTDQQKRRSSRGEGSCLKREPWPEAAQQHKKPHCSVRTHRCGSSGSRAPLACSRLPHGAGVQGGSRSSQVCANVVLARRLSGAAAAQLKQGVCTAAKRASDRPAVACRRPCERGKRLRQPKC